MTSSAAQPEAGAQAAGGPAERIGTTPGRGRRILLALASPRWMLAFFVFAAVGGLVAIHAPDWLTVAWVPPLAMFAVSLLAAIATNTRFRRDPALLGLHLGLLALVVLIALARLTYLDGAVTLTQRTAFDGELHIDRRGPLHHGGIERLRFSNEGFAEDFARRLRWKTTYNKVRWWDEQGVSGVVEIGDDAPLLIGGYRIYTTFNRGYSPVFHWQPVHGEEEVGTVQLRADHDFGMANEWQLPGGPEIWVMLDPQEPTAIEQGARRANLGVSDLAHRLVIRIGERREVIGLGEGVELPEGRLTYVDLDSWMGYKVVYDLAMYWMASAAAAVVICMIWFYGRLLRRTGRDEPAGQGL